MIARLCCGSLDFPGGPRLIVAPPDCVSMPPVGEVGKEQNCGDGEHENEQRLHVATRSMEFEDMQASGLLTVGDLLSLLDFLRWHTGEIAHSYDVDEGPEIERWDQYGSCKIMTENRTKKAQK